MKKHLGPMKVRTVLVIGVVIMTFIQIVVSVMTGVRIHPWLETNTQNGLKLVPVKSVLTESVQD